MCLWHCRVIEPVCITGTNNERNIRPKRSPSPMMNSTAWAKKLLYVMTSENGSYIKLFSMLFSTLSGVKAVKLIFWLSPYLDILCKVQRNHTTLKYPLMQTVELLYTISSKFTIDTLIGSPLRTFQWTQDEHRTLSLSFLKEGGGSKMQCPKFEQ